MITLSTEKGLVRIESWEDVESRPGFTRNLDPSTAVLGEIIGQYHFKDMFPCGLAGCRQPHAKGYLVTTKDGRETNIGNVCGVRYFSVEFTQLRKVFRVSREDQERRERLHALQSRVPGLRAELYALRNGSPTLQSLQVHIGVLLGRTGGLPRGVREAIARTVRSGTGALTYQRVLTKLERDRLRAAQEGAGNASRGSIPVAVDETVGQLMGFAALAPSSDMRSLLVAIETALDQLVAADVDSLDSRALKTLSKLTRVIDPAPTSLREARAHALKLLAAENLRQLEVFTDSPSERRVLRDFIASAAAGPAAPRQPAPVA